MQVWSELVGHRDRVLSPIGVSVMDAVVRVRSVVWVARTIVLTLVFTLLVTHALAGAAL